MICQPIKTYKTVESLSNLPVKKSFITIPVTAKLHVSPKINHPNVPSRTMIVKGVYEPAINTYIAA